MPSVSERQHRMMVAVAHSPSFAKKVGVAQSVGKDFEMADKKARKFGDGGTAVKKPAPKPLPVDPDYEDEGVMKAKPPVKPTKPVKPDPDTLGVKKYAKGGKTMKGCGMKKAKGGTFRASANGIVKKGKTKAMMPKMAKGGKTKGKC